MSNNIKITALPYDINPEASSEGYGPEYMCRVSAKTARGLARMYPMPRMGESLTVAIPRLALVNVSGSFYLRHTDVPIRDWPSVFRIEVIQSKDSKASKEEGAEA
ncbi:hypothetical protein [Hydrogenophaga sp. NFH-34]|uniref:hypothetical protein n=1 Tax=Hydrogenophaga sp. NFH-34 TaxID=2744446 RepID=UPI001F46DE68|nr:hypothetical protein [Hydrogenophaga sp. NFH-34]